MSANIDKKTRVQKMFDGIAGQYDLLNHLLSFGIDIYWRKKALKLTKFNNDAVLLDIACGTGDFAIEAENFGVKNIFGADVSFNMLKHFHEKKNWSRGKTVQMVAELIPLKDNSITNITVAFGVRNFYNIEIAFKEFKRVLSTNGKATILEFRLPSNFLLKKLYNFYFNNILPFVGGLISKDKSAYRYLPDSVKEFDEKVDLVSIFKSAQFKTVKKYSLTFGTVQVVIAEK